MIGTFWNMCRACPSVPVDKLHSEYRSTYRWHEYTGPRQEIVRRAPQGIIAGQIQEPAFPRRKKHPEVAYKVHEFLTDGGAEALLDKSFLNDRARSEERQTSSQGQNSRRSKSEGPLQEKASYRLISTKPINTLNRSSAFTKDRHFLLNDKNEELKTSAVHNRNHVITKSIYSKGDEIKITPSPTSNFASSRINEVYCQNAPKKSVSMNGLKNKESNSQETVPVHKKTAGPKSESDQKILKNVRTGPDFENNNLENPRSDETDGEFKSEYKKNFQPFNSYDYDESKGVFEKRAAPINSSFNPSEIDSPSSNWYKEVVHLRQKANQYRYRGWGTELIPEHIAQLYNNQILVWEQVSRRSTLSALSLASTAHITRDESSKEDKENKRSSPVRFLTRAKSAKTSQATSTHKSRPAVKKAPGQARASSKSQVVSSPKKGNNQVKKLGIKRTSPNRTRQSTSAVGGNPPIIHKSLNENLDKSNRRPRPTSLITSVPSGSKITRKKKKDKSDGEVEDFPSLENEHIVKSPLEPTRVKSPEQIVIRSPEPVNWTVPLDTGKTFTVTQNIREGDAAPKSLSEAKAWTSGSAPPRQSASVSAPTQLIELTKSNVKEGILTK